MFGGVNMCKVQIYIEKHKKYKKVSELGGCRLSTGGEGI